MSFWNRWLKEALGHSPARQTQSRQRGLILERLESREVMNATPLPVLLVIADQQDFYFKEYSDTAVSLQNAGVDVVIAATTTNPSIPHPNSGQPQGTNGAITPDIALVDVQTEDYSAIAFVGGWGSSMYQYAYNDPNGDGVTDNFYWNWPYNGDNDLNDGVIAPQKIVVNNLINEFLAEDKPVAAICHGATVLAWARVDGVSPLAGRQVSVPLDAGAPNQFYNGAERVYPYASGQYDQVLANGGIANTVSGQYGSPSTNHDDVVVDGRIITAENYDAATRFGEVIAEEVLAALAPSNQAPIADDAVWSIAENTKAGTLVGTVNANDPDVGQSHTYAIESGNAHGAFAIDATTGAITIANPAALNFEVMPQYSLTIRVTDNGAPALSDTASITLQITDANDAPTLLGNHAALPSIAEDLTNSAGVLVSTLASSSLIADADAGAVRGIAVISGPVAGGRWQFSTNNGTTWIDIGTPSTTSARLLAADTSTRVRFVPFRDFNGIVSFAFRAWDRSSGSNGGVADTTQHGGSTALSSASAIAQLAITPVNDAPVNGVRSAISIFRNGALPFVGANAIRVHDVDAGSRVIRVTLSATRGIFSIPSGTGLSSLLGNNTGTMVLQGTISALNAALARVTYRSPIGFIGTTDVVVTTNDLGNTGSGGAKTDIDRIRLTVSNRPPLTKSPLSSFTSYAGRANTMLNVNVSMGVLRAFVDPDSDRLTAQLVTKPSKGTLTLRGDGSFFYIPPTNFKGKVSFVARAFDGNLFSQNITFTINVM